MGNKLYVGNLPYGVRDNDLEQAFGAFGGVTSAKVMMERDTRPLQRLWFCRNGSDAEAQAAINGMNGQSLGSPRHRGERSPSHGAAPPFRRFWWLWRRRRWLAVAARRRRRWSQ